MFENKFCALKIISYQEKNHMGFKLPYFLQENSVFYGKAIFHGSC